MSLDQTFTDTIEGALERVLTRVLPSLVAPQTATKLAYSVPEVAEQCSMSEHEVYELLRAGTLQGIRGAKGKWIVPHQHLMSYLLGTAVTTTLTDTARSGVRQRKASGQR
ncbi:helix-turn-helix domain-containing protein [Deinococcus pimensis]|uniref:helix-turn-helix domain-containing protein n=1 Tax=Deinococcus pimensis TaxID=309888 RepID=UPI000489CC7F|nr:helix-turn-helix domain-containing protein [Deinococcus pimensis]